MANMKPEERACLNFANPEYEDPEPVPATYVDFMAAVKRHPDSRNVLLGPRWDVDKIARKREEAYFQLQHELHPDRPATDKWDESILKDVTDFAMKNPSTFHERMRTLMGEPLSRDLTHTQIMARAELYAERASHGRWNSGYERHRFSPFSEGHRMYMTAKIWIDAFVFYLDVSDYRILSPELRRQFELEASMAARGLLPLGDESAEEVAQKVTEWLKQRSLHIGVGYSSMQEISEEMKAMLKLLPTMVLSVVRTLMQVVVDLAEAKLKENAEDGTPSKVYSHSPSLPTLRGRLESVIKALVELSVHAPTVVGDTLL